MESQILADLRKNGSFTFIILINKINLKSYMFTPISTKVTSNKILYLLHVLKIYDTF